MTEDWKDYPRPAPAPIHNGGPAFPHDVPQGWGTGGPITRHYPGMTLRDYFAGQAIVGVLQSRAFDDNMGDLSLRAYVLADAMLRARG